MDRLGLIGRFRRRSAPEKALLFRTALLFIVSHVLLRMRTLAAVRAGLQRAAARLAVTAADIPQLQWSVEAVGLNLPGKHSCLIQALVCEAIAANSGIPATLRIGAKREVERHHFHAWVEHEGNVIVGHDHDGFAALA